MTVTGHTAAAPAARARASARPGVSDVVGGLGLLVLVGGTFLPWARSGTTVRSSYTADGVIRRLLAPNGLTGAVLTLWPLVSLLCAAALAMGIAGFTRTGGGLAALCAVVAGVVCIRVLLLHPSALTRVAPLGPSVTLAGCVLVLLALALSLTRRSRRLR